MPAIARFRNRFLRKLVLGAGWIAFVLVLLLTAFERSGLLADMLRKELRGHLGALPQGGGTGGGGALHLNVGGVCLHGTLGADRQLRLETLATGLPVSKAYLPEQAHDFQPQGSLALEGHVGADLRPEGRASGTLRLSLSEGSLYVAHGTQRVDHLALEFDGHVETEDVGMALDPGAWECALKASGTWEQHRFEGWGFLGPALAAGARARGFVHLPALPLDGSIVELIATEPLERAKLEARWKPFTPRGE